MILTFSQSLFIFLPILLGETFGYLFGGGGFFIQPALLAAGVPAKIAVANDIAAAAFASLGFILTTKERTAQVKRVTFLTAPTLIFGAFLGGNVLRSISEEIVRAIILMICTAGFLYTVSRFQRRIVFSSYGQGSPIPHWKLALFGAGMIIGFYDGISGAGGRIITIVALSLILRDDIKTVITMANCVSAVSLTSAGLTFLYMGLLDFQLLAIMIPAALLAGFLAAKISSLLSEKILRGTYAVVLACLLVYLYADWWQR